MQTKAVKVLNVYFWFCTEQKEQFCWSI